MYHVDFHGTIRTRDPIQGQTSNILGKNLNNFVDRPWTFCSNRAQHCTNQKLSAPSIARKVKAKFHFSDGTHILAPADVLMSSSPNATVNRENPDSLMLVSPPLILVRVEGYRHWKVNSGLKNFVPWEQSTIPVPELNQN